MSRKDGTVNSTKKGNKKSFRDLVALEQGLEGQEVSISPAKTGKEIPNKERHQAQN